MLEIIAVILLCNKNSSNAKARGRSGGAAIAYTLGLWFGGELLGVLIGIAANGGEMSPPVYIAALLFAAGGGTASYFIAKSGNVQVQGQPLSYTQNGVPLSASNYSQQASPQPNSQQVRPLSSVARQASSAHSVAYQTDSDHPVAFQTGSAQCRSCNMALAPGQLFCVNCGTPAASSQPAHQTPSVQPGTPSLSAQTLPETSSIIFLAKKMPGQFLVSSATIAINGVSYQAKFNQPIVLQAPAGNVQIDCYLNYMGKSGAAQAVVFLQPNQSYQVEYKSPMVVSSSGTLNVVAV